MKLLIIGLLVLVQNARADVAPEYICLPTDSKNTEIVIPRARPDGRYPSLLYMTFTPDRSDDDGNYAPTKVEIDHFAITGFQSSGNSPKTGFRLFTYRESQNGKLARILINAQHPGQAQLVYMNGMKRALDCSIKISPFFGRFETTSELPVADDVGPKTVQQKSEKIAEKRPAQRQQVN